MKKLFLYIFLGFLWCNVSFAKIFTWTCLNSDQFQMVFKINDSIRTITHISSYDFNTKKKFTVNRNLEILEWGDKYIWTTTNYDNYSRNMTAFDLKTV